jgi:hypothetical protein
VLDPDDTMTATQGRQGLRALNMMTGLWSLMPTTSPVTSREVFDLVANQGGPDNPYTIGPSGDFDTTRPQSILAASYLQYPGTAQEIEVPRAVITTDAWQQISVKQLSNTLFTCLYYSPTYADDLGSIFLWPIPDNADYDLVLYRSAQISRFPSLSATIDLPEGTEEAIQMNVTVRLAPYYEKSASQDVKDFARNSLAAIMRNNLPLSDLPTDASALTRDQRGAYNIVSGQGGGA